MERVEELKPEVVRVVVVRFVVLGLVLVVDETPGGVCALAGVLAFDPLLNDVLTGIPALARAEVLLARISRPPLM